MHTFFWMMVLFSPSDCFKKVLPLGPGIATMTTFAASVMLHGLNFQLGAVLLSLGFFAYAEHELRRKLSVMFDASLGSSRSTECRHTEWELPVALFNLGCGMLVVLNLAYLGVMFNQEGIMVSPAGYFPDGTFKLASVTSSALNM